MYNMITISEILPTPESNPLINEAAMLIFKHIGQREIGYSEHNIVVQNRYLEDVEVSRLFVAQNKKAKIIGAATLRLPLTSIDYQLEYLAVLPKYRREGVGTSLLETVEEKVIDIGCTRLIVEPLDSVEEFYQSRGYDFEKSRQNDFMVKELLP